MTVTQEEMRLKLPRVAYGTICLKILGEFIEHHKLEGTITLPKDKMAPHEVLEMILDIMLHSMGPDKREKSIKDATAYLHDLPYGIR